MSRMNVLAVLALSACAPALYSGRATPSSLQCALQFGLSKGYQPTSGGTNAGFLRLERHDFDVLTVSVVSDTMHVEAKSIDREGQGMAATDATRVEAREMLRRCGPAT